MRTRHLVLALLLAPLLALALSLGLSRAGTRLLLPGLDPAAVARVELARGREQVVLQKRLDTGGWQILSAADAPGDSARIEAMLQALAGLRGRPLADGSRAPAREPLQLRLLDAEGDQLGHAAFWAGEAQTLPSGPRLTLEKAPALPLWASAWSSLKPPQLDIAKLEEVQALTPEGPRSLPPEAVGAAARVLLSLGPGDFVAARSVNWAGARQLRLIFADGRVIDVQQVPDGAGRHHLRLTSDTDPAIRETRRFAFRTVEALP
jgi:hypothetical protein